MSEMGVLLLGAAEGNKTVRLRCEGVQIGMTPAEAVFLARQLLAAARFVDPFKDTDEGMSDLVRQMFRDD